jgi:hypothetical protein
LFNIVGLIVGFTFAPFACDALDLFEPFEVRHERLDFPEVVFGDGGVDVRQVGDDDVFGGAADLHVRVLADHREVVLKGDDKIRRTVTQSFKIG